MEELKSGLDKSVLNESLGVKEKVNSLFAYSITHYFKITKKEIGNIIINQERKKEAFSAFLLKTGNHLIRGSHIARNL